MSTRTAVTGFVLAFSLAFAIPAIAKEQKKSATADQNDVVLQTDLGDIVVRLEPVKAPATVSHFLNLLDTGAYASGPAFYRAIEKEREKRPETERASMIVGGLGLEVRNYPAIKFESSKDSGLKHTDGAIALSRQATGDVTTEFQILIGDNPSMDFGGQRYPGGEGNAVFGYVIKGMDIVRKIQNAPTDSDDMGQGIPNQILLSPVKFTVRRSASHK